MSFTYTAAEGATQGELASSYTNELSAYLQGDGADYVAFLSYVASGSTDVEAALALKDAVEAGNFSLSGLFSAAQSKTGEVPGDDITNPTPTLTVTLADGSSVTIDLTAMLTGLDTETWTTIAKKAGTIYHTREFYGDSREPDDYDANWAADNAPPDAKEIIASVTEYDEHAAGADLTGTAKLVTVNLLDSQYVTDPDGDTLSVVAGSVTLANGDALPSYIVDNGDGTISIDTNSAEFDALYKYDDPSTTDVVENQWNIDLTYQISDGVNAPVFNTVDLTITGTADQFTDSTKITVDKIGADAYTETGSYALLGFDWSNGSVNVTGVGDYDRNNEGFTVSLDVDATFVGTATTGNNEATFIAVNPAESLDTNWSDDGDLDYTVSFLGPVDGYTEIDPDASAVNIDLSYSYWM